MTVTQHVITISVCALATVLTRALPFIIFSSSKPTPKYIKYLGDALPAAVFAMLVVYCFKNLDLTSYSYGIPELIATAAVVGIHLYKRNTILSIALGTVTYMLLVQLVF